MAHVLDRIHSDIQALIQGLDNVVVVWDGQIIHTQLTPAFEALSFENLSPDDARLDLYNATLDTEDPAVKYNLENRTQSLVIRVPQKFHAADTLHVFYLQGLEDQVQQMIIHCEQGAQLNFFEVLANHSTSGINLLTQAVCDDYAQLDYRSLCAYGKDAVAALHRQALIGERANATYTLAVFGDAKLTQNTHHVITGYQGESLLKAVTLTSGQQEVFIRSLVEHRAKDSSGNIEHYGVANDESFLTFEGMGKIHKGMIQSKAFQSTKGVVLAPKARLDANPLLVIDEYDVEAGHGAAIGRIDEEQLYYMMSRGMTKKQAERLIINGFLAPMSDLLQEASFDHYIRQLLSQKTL